MEILLSLGPFGQIPSMRTYTILTLIFPLNDEKQNEVISTLEKAANEIVLSYPWLAGQVVIEEPRDGNGLLSGTCKVVEFQPHSGTSKFVYVKDCKKLCPSYAEIIKARAPSSMLDGNIICPAHGFPTQYPNNVTQPAMFMQANFIKGGLLLTVCGHHTVMDANGNEQFIRQFASLCRGEKLLPEHIRMGNIDQHIIISPLEAGITPANVDLARTSSTLDAPPAPFPLPPSAGHWKYVRFPAVKIAALKAEASKDIDPTSDVKYISSNDAISAFIWERLSAIRATTASEDRTTNLIRAVNSRKRLNSPISEGYMGHVIICFGTTLPITTVSSHSHYSRSTITTRRSLQEIDDHHVRSFFSLLKTEKDLTKINYGARFNTETDLMITSFVAQKLYSTDFGEVLGMPTFIRRPRLSDCRSLCYMMPITGEGDVDVVLGLSIEDFEGLKADGLWGEFTEAIDY